MAAETGKEQTQITNQANGVWKRSTIPSKIVPARAEEARSKKNVRSGSDENGGEAIVGVIEEKGKEWMGEEVGFGDRIYSERSEKND